ncbi:MAG: tetratricopeptide repeat protein [Vicinamibacteria bacterium]
MRNVVLPCAVLLGTICFFVVAYHVFSRDYQYVQLVKLGDQLVQEELPYQATRTYGSAIGLRPDKPLAYLKRASALQEQGNLAAALADLSEAEKLGADPLTVAQRQADIQYQRGSFDQAVELYSKVLTLHPGSPPVLYQLGLACFRAGREEAALSALGQAIESREGFVEAHYLRAAVSRSLGRVDDAESDLVTALSLRPDAGETRSALIELYLETGNAARALEVANEEIDRQPHAAHSYLRLADVHRMSGRTDQAIEAVGLAIEQDPNLPDAYLRLGELWLEDGLLRNDRVALEKAITALESVVMMDSENGPAALALGRAYLAIGNEAAAFEELEHAAEATPIQADAHRILGDLYLARGAFTEAATAYHVYLKLSDQNPMRSMAPVVMERLGDAYVGMGNASEAAETYMELAALVPNRVIPFIKAARAYLAAGELTLARRACTQGLRADVENKDLLDLLVRSGGTLPQGTDVSEAAPSSSSR